MNHLVIRVKIIIIVIFCEFALGFNPVNKIFNFNPIGYFYCDRDYHQEQPMQGVLSDAGGFIELIKGFNYEQGLKDLDGFEYVWVFFIFHLNNTWRPLTNPPYSDGNGKKGVFATRSPYRPNPLGMSCTRLVRISANKIFLAGSDLLNGTPIIDIKPYIPEYDSFPQARRGWLQNVVKKVFTINYEGQVQAKIDFLKNNGIDLTGVIKSQLGHNPFDQTRNKFEPDHDMFLLRFKSWRIAFIIVDATVIIKKLWSGYQSYEKSLGNDSDQDLVIHRKFNRHFNSAVPAD